MATISRPSKSELRDRVVKGDIPAAVHLINLTHPKRLKDFICFVCAFENPLTFDLFDTCADAWAVAKQKETQ